MKGQGASFGYELVSTIGSSFCDFLRGREAVSDDAMLIIKAHMDALMVVFEHNLKGDGGELGLSLADRLRGLVTSHSG